MSNRGIILTQRVLAGLAAGALLILAVPQTGDAIFRQYADDRLSRTASNASAATIAALSGASLLEAADRWFGDPQARIRAGSTQLRLAYQSHDASVPDLEMVATAATDLADGLRRAPANALAWVELAHADLELGDQESAVRALKTSMLLAPYEPSLSLWRVELGMQLWPTLDPEVRRLVSQQLRDAWETRPLDVARLGKLPGNRDRLAEVLAPYPDLQVGLTALMNVVR